MQTAHREVCHLPLCLFGPQGLSRPGIQWVPHKCFLHGIMTVGICTKHCGSRDEAHVQPVRCPALLRGLLCSRFADKEMQSEREKLRNPFTVMGNQTLSAYQIPFHLPRLR